MKDESHSPAADTHARAAAARAAAARAAAARAAAARAAAARATACCRLLLCALALLLALLPHPALAQVAGDTAAEIVYIDASGVVRVRDSKPAGGVGITWFSPVGGYLDAIVLDVNRDSDMEIAALRSASGALTLDIYDPVVATGPTAPGQSIGNVPWQQLASIPLGNPVGIMAAGNLDGGAPGNEILLSARVATTGVGGVTLYKQSLYYMRNVGAQDGRSWEFQSLPISDEDWSSVALGDLEGDGIDEIGLVAAGTGTLAVWQMRGPADSARVFVSESNSRPWLDVAIGPFLRDKNYLGAVRDAPIGLPSLLIMAWSNGTLTDEYGRDFDPSPNTIFFGDVNADGFAEAWMIRYVDPADTVKPRLFQRQRGTPIPLFEDRLDADNGFKVGASADIDGDGRDEIVLIRTDRIREYLTPDTATTFADSPLQNNGRTLALGDLDRIGYLPEVSLQSSLALVTQSAPTGVAETVSKLTISSAPASPSVPIRVTVQDQPSWLHVGADQQQTPAQLLLTFDATALPLGTYTTQVRISSPSALVTQQPLVILVSFQVLAGLRVQPLSLVLPLLDCTNAPTQTARIAVDAGVPKSYSVAVINANSEAATAVDTSPRAATPDVTWPSSVPWLTATSPTGTAPESITLTVDPSRRDPAGPSALAARVLIVVQSGSTQIVRTLPVTLLCGATQIGLPLVARQ